MPEPKKKVTVWETFDGKEFEFKGDAERHESALWEKMGANFQAINDHLKIMNTKESSMNILLFGEDTKVMKLGLLQRKKKV